MLTLYNTATRTKERFEPIDPSNVRLYVCGPTVYDFAHIGNARPIIVFDVLFRLLRHLYGTRHVTYARNITDIDDKINARAGALPRAAADRGDPQADQRDDGAVSPGMWRRLACLPPTREPRATEHIAEMRALIEALVARGHAYVAQEHVLFDVATLPDYGRFREPVAAGNGGGRARRCGPLQEGPMDFVLWKPSGLGCRAGIPLRHCHARSAGLAHRVLGSRWPTSSYGFWPRAR